jgi:hypothetical protein
MRNWPVYRGCTPSIFFPRNLTHLEILHHLLTDFVFRFANFRRFFPPFFFGLVKVEILRWLSRNGLNFCPVDSTLESFELPGQLAVIQVRKQGQFLELFGPRMRLEEGEKEATHRRIRS